MATRVLSSKKVNGLDTELVDLSDNHPGMVVLAVVVQDPTSVRPYEHRITLYPKDDGSPWTPEQQQAMVDAERQMVTQRIKASLDMVAALDQIDAADRAGMDGESASETTPA